MLPKPLAVNMQDHDMKWRRTFGQATSPVNTDCWGKKKDKQERNGTVDAFSTGATCTRKPACSGRAAMRVNECTQKVKLELECQEMGPVVSAYFQIRWGSRLS